MDWFFIVRLEEDEVPEIPICPNSHSWRVILGKATKRMELNDGINGLSPHMRVTANGGWSPSTSIFLNSGQIGFETKTYF